MSASIRASSSASNSNWGVGTVTSGTTLQDGGFNQPEMLAISDFANSYGLNVRGFTAQLQGLQQADFSPRHDVDGAVRGLTNFIRDAFGPSTPSGGSGPRPASWGGGSRPDGPSNSNGPGDAEHCHHQHGHRGPAGSSGAAPSGSASSSGPAPSGSASSGSTSSGSAPSSQAEPSASSSATTSSQSPSVQNASTAAQAAQSVQPAQARRSVSDPTFLNALSSLMKDLGFSDKTIQSVSQALRERDPAASAHSEHTVSGVYAA